METATSQANVLKDSTLLTRLPSLTSNELLPLFNAFWVDTAGAFCEEFSLDKKQFKKWLKGKSAGADADAAVKEVLRQALTTQREGRRRPLQSINRYGALAKNEYLLSGLEGHISKLASRRELSTAILVDGDACSNEVRKLEWMLPEGGDAGFHALAVAGSRTSMPPWWPATADWCSLIRLEEALPNEADYTISVAASSWIKERRRNGSSSSSLQMYIVARDKFAEPLSVVLKKTYGIACAGIDPTTVSLSLVFLFELSTPLPPLSPTALGVKAVLDAHYTRTWAMGDSSLAEKLSGAFKNEKLCSLHATAATIRFLDELFVQRRIALQRTASPHNSPPSTPGDSPQSVSSRHSPEKPTAVTSPTPDATLSLSSHTTLPPTMQPIPNTFPLTPVTPTSLSSSSSSSSSSHSLQQQLPALSATAPIFTPLKPPADPKSLFPPSILHAPSSSTPSSFTLPTTRPAPPPLVRPLSISAPIFQPLAPLSTPPCHAGKSPQAAISTHPWLLALRDELATRTLIPLSEIGHRYPCENLASLGYTKWAHLLELPTVQELLNADFIAADRDTAPVLRSRRAAVHPQLPSPQQQQQQLPLPAHPPPPPRAVAVESLSDEDLRREWKLRWRYTQREFCDKYSCNQGNFSSWLNKRRLTSPASSAAVRAWLREEKRTEKIV